MIRHTNVGNIRCSVGSVSLRANRYTGGRLDRWAFVIKPAEEEKHKWLHKLAIEPAYGRASISTSKLKLWEFLRVQIVAHYDCETRSPGLQWRVSSKWSRGQGKLGRKEKLRSNALPALGLHPHWRMDLFMPEVEGRLGGFQRNQSVYLEKGHCHVSVPKLEVLLDVNNLQGTKQDLRSLLSRIGRRNRKAVTEKPIPGGQSEAASIAAMDSSSHSTSAEPVHAVPAAKGRDRGAALTSSPSAWYAAPQQPRGIRATLRSHGDDTFGSQQQAQDPIHHILQNLQHMWNRLTCVNSAGVR
ncbi:hypothetical protein CVIRNUC_006228 [Coccomyxa viridis]|uniref:DUF7781 domain-containing protein n=1 Tax=Coccomyxa viridis TaxID=1274662 RepID=A0AAV1I6Q4_9CHLO|nr:hypothetical protein CVIRNUC_006228 [Coccomyxa viridis]